MSPWWQRKWSGEAKAGFNAQEGLDEAGIVAAAVRERARREDAELAELLPESDAEMRSRLEDNPWPLAKRIGCHADDVDRRLAAMTGAELDALPVAPRRAARPCTHRDHTLIALSRARWERHTDAKDKPERWQEDGEGGRLQMALCRYCRSTISAPFADFSRAVESQSPMRRASKIAQLFGLTSDEEACVAVTEALLRAEREGTEENWLAVAACERRLAELLPAGSVEAGIADRGVISAEREAQSARAREGK